VPKRYTGNPAALGERLVAGEKASSVSLELRVLGLPVLSSLLAGGLAWDPIDTRPARIFRIASARGQPSPGSI